MSKKNKSDDEPLELSLDDMLINDDLPLPDELEDAPNIVEHADVKETRIANDVFLSLDEAERELANRLKHELQQTFDHKLEKLILTQMPKLVAGVTDQLMARLPETIAVEILPSLHKALKGKRDTLIEKSLMAIADQLGKDKKS